MSGWPGHTRPHWNFFLKKEGGDGGENKGIRDAGSTADFRILFENLENFGTLGKF